MAPLTEVIGRLIMNILNAMFRTACRFDNWSVYSGISNDLSRYTREMRVAESKEQQDEIRKAMIMRFDRPRL